MPDISSLVATPRALSAQRPPARGVVSRAPGSVADVIGVVLPAFSTEYEFEAPWTPRGSTLPALGANCLVVFDDAGAAYVAWWEGESSYATKFSTATHAAGTTISIPAVTHGIAGALAITVQNAASGDVIRPDINVSGANLVTVSFAAPQAADTIRVTLVG